MSVQHLLDIVSQLQDKVADQDRRISKLELEIAAGAAGGGANLFSSGGSHSHHSGHHPSTSSTSSSSVAGAPLGGHSFRGGHQTAGGHHPSPIVHPFPSGKNTNSIPFGGAGAPPGTIPNTHLYNRPDTIVRLHDGQEITQREASERVIEQLTARNVDDRCRTYYEKHADMHAEMLQFLEDEDLPPGRDSSRDESPYWMTRLKKFLEDVVWRETGGGALPHHAHGHGVAPYGGSDQRGVLLPPGVRGADVSGMVIRILKDERKCDDRCVQFWRDHPEAHADMLPDLSNENLPPGRSADRDESPY